STQHLITVAADGSLFVATVPTPGTFGAADPSTFEWYSPDGKLASKVTRPEPSGLVAVTAIDTYTFHGVALALREALDDGLGESRVELWTRTGDLSATWLASRDVTLTAMASNGTIVEVLGTSQSGPAEKPWLAALGLPDMTLRS